MNCRGLGLALRNHVTLAFDNRKVCKRVRKYTPNKLSIRSFASSVSLYSRSCENLVISVVFIKRVKSTSRLLSDTVSGGQRIPGKKTLVETKCCFSANHLIFAQFVWCYLALIAVFFSLSVAAMEKLKFIQDSAELAKLTGNYYCTDFFISSWHLWWNKEIGHELRTKDEHADRCHVTLTSYVITYHNLKTQMFV